MSQMGGPGAADNVFSPKAFHHYLIRQATSFAEHEQVKRIAQIIMIDNWVLRRVFRLESDLSVGPGRKELGRHRESVFAVAGKVPEEILRAVAFRVPKLDVWLAG